MERCLNTLMIAILNLSLILFAISCGGGGGDSTTSNHSTDTASQENSSSQEVDILTFNTTPVRYSMDSDMDAICKQTFGGNYNLADWNDIVYAYDNGTDPDDILMEGNAYISNGGDELWSSTRHYLITRHDHVCPSTYLSHDDIDDHLFDLGSWYTDQPILCSSDSGDADTPTDNFDNLTKANFPGIWKITISNSTQITENDYYIDVTLNSNGTLSYTEYHNSSIIDSNTGIWTYDESTEYFHAVGYGDLCKGFLSYGATINTFSVPGTFYSESSVIYNWVRISEN